jgi:hypothetical protein
MCHGSELLHHLPRSLPTWGYGCLGVEERMSTCIPPKMHYQIFDQNTKKGCRNSLPVLPSELYRSGSGREKKEETVSTWF